MSNSHAKDFFTMQAGNSQTKMEHLNKGIQAYYAGNYDTSLFELNKAVEQNTKCPLAYYYASQIRILKKQYARAEKNLKIALKDSTDFSDAQALLVYIYKKWEKEKK